MLKLEWGAGAGGKLKGKFFGLAANIEANIRPMIIGSRKEQTITINSCNGNYSISNKSNLLNLTHNLQYGVTLFSLAAMITFNFNISIGFELKINTGSSFSISVFSEGHIKIEGTLGFPFIKPIERYEIAYQSFNESKIIFSA